MNPKSTNSQSPKDSVFLKCETKSLNTIVMPVMMIEAINLKRELASMKVMLKKLSKENAKKDAKIKHQNGVSYLTKKLEKRSLEASNKGLQSKESDEESNHSKDSDKEHKSKKGSSLCSLSIENIQSLTADAMKLQLGKGSYVTHNYSKPYTKKISALNMPLGY